MLLNLVYWLLWPFVLLIPKGRFKLAIWLVFPKHYRVVYSLSKLETGNFTNSNTKHNNIFSFAKIKSEYQSSGVLLTPLSSEPDFGYYLTPVNAALHLKYWINIRSYVKDPFSKLLEVLYIQDKSKYQDYLYSFVNGMHKGRYFTANPSQYASTLWGHCKNTSYPYFGVLSFGSGIILTLVYCARYIKGK